MKLSIIKVPSKSTHPCPQQTFRFIKNGHLQLFVFQKVWYIGVTKSIKLNYYFCQIFILWILEVFDVTEVKKDPKTHENLQTIE